MSPHHIIRVLGPVDVWTPEGVREIGGHNPRAVLGALVVSVGRTVSADQLIDIVWGGDSPPGAQATLQAYVSRLRRVLGTESIRLVDHGYVLALATEQIDALRFEHLVRSAHDAVEPSRVRSLCREALGMWRGVPFGELADLDPFRLEAIRLDEIRLTAMEALVQAELHLGNHGLMIGSLEAAVREYPYRERLWYMLIEALAREGRRVEALRSCDELRKLLGGVGLEGGSALGELEDRILAGGDPTASG
jgi:DNA-binding SARP family transcriptional activator